MCLLGCLFCSLPQLPYAITVNESDLCNLLPLEFAAWLLRKLMVEDRRWVLVVTADVTCNLAANIVMCSPQGLNCVVGLTGLSSSPVCNSPPVMMMTCFGDVRCM